MNRKLLMAAVILLLLLPLAASADLTEWTADKAHSQIRFSVRHFLTPVPGTFDDFDGKIAYDPANVEGSSVAFTVQAASVNTKNEQRDGHLRSPDFFDTEKFTTLSFESTSVKKAGDGLSVTGKLTIHGETRQVTIPVDVLGVMDTPMGTKAGFTTEFTIDRKDFGITWNRALDQGGAILGDDVKISISIEANKVAPEAK